MTEPTPEKADLWPSDSALLTVIYEAKKFGAAWERKACAELELPERPSGYTDSEWQMFKYGWFAHIDAIRARSQS